MRILIKKFFLFTHILSPKMGGLVLLSLLFFSIPISVFVLDIKTINGGDKNLVILNKLFAEDHSVDVLEDSDAFATTGGADANTGAQIDAAAGRTNSAADTLGIGGLEGSAYKKAPLPTKSEASCGIFNVGTCIVVAFAWVIYTLTSYITALTGMLLDVMIAVSLQKSTYTSDFIQNGWATIRDLTNIVFIFILLYIAIGTILQLSSFDTKKTLTTLIVAALLINFSLFATRIVIDSSNILAELFYKTITAPTVGGIKVASLPEVKSISGSFTDGFDPQKMLGVENYVALFNKGSVETAATLFTIYMLASIINIIAAWAFLIASFLFISRIAMLWGLMITAPLPFIAMILDKTKKHSTTWWNTLFSQAFLAPVFLFFIYLLLQLAGSDILGNLQNRTNITVGTAGGDVVQQAQGNAPILLSVILAFSLLIVALIKAVEITKKMGGEAGAMVTGLGMKAAGMLAGGGVGMFARNTLGRGMSALARNERFEKWAGESKVGEMLHRGTRGVAGASFDARGIPFAGKGGFGKASGKGGFAAAEAKNIKQKQAYGDSLQSDAAKVAYGQRLQRGITIPIFNKMITTRAGREAGAKIETKGHIGEYTATIRQKEAALEKKTRLLATGAVQNDPGTKRKLEKESQNLKDELATLNKNLSNAKQQLPAEDPLKKVMEKLVALEEKSGGGSEAKK